MSDRRFPAFDRFPTFDRLPKFDRFPNFGRVPSLDRVTSVAGRNKRESFTVAVAAAGLVAVAASSVVSVADSGGAEPQVTMAAEQHSAVADVEPVAKRAAEAAHQPKAEAIPAPAPLPAPGPLPAPMPTPEPAPAAPEYPDNLDGWIREALDIMHANNIPGSYDSIMRNIMRESTGDPQAINNWDVNATAGTPSKGLLQVIEPTFAANHVAGTPHDVWDPVANIVAACNYAAQRYGSMDNVNGAY